MSIPHSIALVDFFDSLLAFILHSSVSVKIPFSERRPVNSGVALNSFFERPIVTILGCLQQRIQSLRNPFAPGKWALLFLSLVFSGNAVAQSLKSQLEEKFNVRDQARVLSAGQDAEFLRSNELDPVLARGPLAESTAGAFVSVGTERGFLTAPLVNNVSLLFLVDRTYAVTLYNRINTALLKLSRNGDRLHYLNLREAGHHKVWLDALKNSSENFSDSELSLIKDPQAHKFFQASSQKFSLQKLMRGEKRLTEKSKPGHFQHVNYLVFDDQFRILQKLAQQNRIIALNFSLTDEKSVSEFVQDLAQNKIRINVLDISNAWQSKLYIPEKNLRVTLLKFSAVSSQSTLLMATRVNQSSQSNFNFEWNYASLRLQELAKEPGSLEVAIEMAFRNSCRVRLGSEN